MSRKLYIDGSVKLLAGELNSPSEPLLEEKEWFAPVTQQVYAKFKVEIELVTSGDFSDFFTGGPEDVERRVNNYILEKLKEGI